MKMRIAVIGVGYMGEKHVRVLSKFKDVTLAGVCDIAGGRRNKIASEFNTEAYENYRDLIGKVDGVTISTPTKFHYAIARDFLASGVHVLVEKVITSCEKEAKKLIEKAKKKKLVLQVGHVERYNPAVLKLQELISNPDFIECHRMSPYPGRGTETNVVKEVMIHDLDIILQLVGSTVKSIDALGVEVLSETSDIVNARIHFGCGCVANVTASRVSEKALRKIRIFQSNAYISLDYINQAIDILRKGDKRIKKTPIPVERKEPLREELQDFLACMKYNKQPRATGEDGLKALQLANRICRKLKN